MIGNPRRARDRIVDPAGFRQAPGKAQLRSEIYLPGWQERLGPFEQIHRGSGVAAVHGTTACHLEVSCRVAGQPVRVVIGRAQLAPVAEGLLQMVADDLRSVPAPDLERVLAVSRLRTFRRGQVVFTRGDPGDTLIVVVSGRVKIVVRSADGGELTLTIIPAGGVLGELSMADGGPRSADAETLEESQLLLIPRETIQEICARVPSAAQAVANSIAAALRRLTEASSDLVFLDLPRRVAKVLASQAPDDDGVIRVKLRQEELAHHVGATRQSINAAVRGFHRRGWLQIHDGAVIVTQASALSRFAGS